MHTLARSEVGSYARITQYQCFSPRTQANVSDRKPVMNDELGAPRPQTPRVFVERLVGDGTEALATITASASTLTLVPGVSQVGDFRILHDPNPLLLLSSGPSSGTRAVPLFTMYTSSDHGI